MLPVLRDSEAKLCPTKSSVITFNPGKGLVFLTIYLFFITIYLAILPNHLQISSTNENFRY